MFEVFVCMPEVFVCMCEVCVCMFEVFVCMLEVFVGGDHARDVRIMHAKSLMISYDDIV